MNINTKVCKKTNMATVVTAFMTNINTIDFRDIETYMEYGKKLLNQSIPTVCFLEKKVYEHFFKEEVDKYVNTKFIMFEKTDNYLYEFEDKLTKFSLKTDNPKKDTPGYMFIQCHKTEWVRRAIEWNPFKTENFIWIDFGIYHMIRDDTEFAIAVYDATIKKYNSLRIASCRNPNQPYEKDIYRDVAWFFGGSVFGGAKDKLLMFADKTKNKCLEIINEKKHLMWEINIWYLIYKSDPWLFDYYHCNHNSTILQNY